MLVFDDNNQPRSECSLSRDFMITSEGVGLKISSKGNDAVVEIKNFI